MKKTMIAACALIFALVLPLFASADQTPPVTGITVTQDGVLSWDDVPGTEQYWVGVDGGYVPADNGCDITDRVYLSGVYEICVEAVADSGSKTIAAGTARITYSGKSYALGEKSAFGGWWGTSSTDHITSVSIDGTDVPSIGGEFTEPGKEYKIVITPAEGSSVVSAFLRYDAQNREEIALTGRADGSCEAVVAAPDAVWSVGINTTSRLPSFVVHDADFGRLTEGFSGGEHSIYINFKTGDKPLSIGSDYLKAEWSGGDVSAFAHDKIHGSNYADTYEVYTFWVCPVSGLTEGSYSAVLSLYYDKDGKASDWVKIDECSVRVNVVKPGTPVTAMSWWCTSGDYVESFEIDGAEFSSPVQMIPGNTVSATVKPRDGYAVTTVFLRYNDRNTEEGVTTTSQENNEYDVTFTVPDDDFSIGVNVEEVKDTAVGVEFDPNGGDGYMEQIFVQPGDPTVLPENGFTPPDGTAFARWVFLYKDGMLRYGEGAPGDTYIFEADTILRAEWEDIPDIEIIFDGGGADGAMEPEYVKPGDYVLPECGFTDENGRFAGWSVEIYENGAWNELPGGLCEPGTLITAAGERIRLSAAWKGGMTTDETQETAPDGTTGGAPDTDPRQTDGLSFQKSTDESSDKPAEPETRKRAVLPWIMLGLGLGVLLCAGAGVAVILIMKKRASKPAGGNNGADSAK